MWQEIIVGLCITLATAFLIRHYWPGRKSTGSCGQCSGCNSPCDKKE